MKILILDGSPQPESNSSEWYIKKLIVELRSKEHDVNRIVLRDRFIKYCVGCWSCWVKTPGECVFDDDAREICRQYIHSDFVLMFSPVIMGFSSALLKKMQDRLIPLIHPYVEIVQGENHHIKRYESYPKLGILLVKSKDTDEEDIRILTDIYKRFALSLKTELQFSGLTEMDAEEASRAIVNI
jgi:multimeric flavodoxin WrbA